MPSVYDIVCVPVVYVASNSIKYVSASGQLVDDPMLSLWVDGHRLVPFIHSLMAANPQLKPVLENFTVLPVFIVEQLAENTTSFRSKLESRIAELETEVARLNIFDGLKAELRCALRELKRLQNSEPR